MHVQAFRACLEWEPEFSLLHISSTCTLGCRYHISIVWNSLKLRCQPRSPDATAASNGETRNNGTLLTSSNNTLWQLVVGLFWVDITKNSRNFGWKSNAQSLGDSLVEPLPALEFTPRFRLQGHKA